MSYLVTKEFPHSMGFSCVYRNHNAESHCRFLHGYSLSFSVTLSAFELDQHAWVHDFGDFKFVKEYLTKRYDHKMLIAVDDPEVPFLQSLETYRLAQTVHVDACSAEAFARDLFHHVQLELGQRQWAMRQQRVFVYETTCSEHGGNRAAYRGKARLDDGVPSDVP